MEDCQNILECLKLYEEATGQVVNLQKLGVTFSPNMQEKVKAKIINMLQVKTACPHDKYLRLSAFFSKSRTNQFKELKDRIWKKLQNWKGKLLSKAGKKIFIKVVAQAIPTYNMGCFRLLKRIVANLNDILAKF